MRFKNWLLAENEKRTTAKLGLYPPIMGAIGQYPPLYATPSAADMITYIDIEFNGVKNIPGKDGIVRFKEPRHARH